MRLEGCRYRRVRGGSGQEAAAKVPPLARVGSAYFASISALAGPMFPSPRLIIAQLVVLPGCGLTFRVFRENPYASRTVEVDDDRKVVSTGSYAMVRHPMYSRALLIHPATPLASGSYWAIVPAVLIVPITIARIRNEERVLATELEGYRDYLLNTRYRLLPGLW